MVLSPVISYLIYAQFGFLTVNVSIGIVLCLLSVIIMRLLEPRHVDAVYTRPRAFFSIIWKQCSVFVSFIANVIVLTLISFLFVILAFHLKIEWPEVFKNNELFISLYFAFIGGTYLILSPLSILCSNYVGSLKTVILGLILMFAALVIMAVHMLKTNSWLHWPSFVNSDDWTGHGLFGVGCGLIGIACVLCLVPSILYLNNLTHHMFNHNTADMIASVFRLSYSIGLIIGPILAIMFLYEPDAEFSKLNTYWVKSRFDTICFYWASLSFVLLFAIFVLLFCLSWKWRIHYVTPPPSYVYFREQIRKLQQQQQTGGASNLTADQIRKSPLLSQLAGISNVSGLTAMTGLNATAHGRNGNNNLNTNNSNNSNTITHVNSILSQILGNSGLNNSQEIAQSHESRSGSLISSHNDMTLNLQYCMEFNPVLMDDNSFWCFRSVSCFCTIAFCCQYFSKYYYKQQKIIQNLERYDALYNQLQSTQQIDPRIQQRVQQQQQHQHQLVNQHQQHGQMGDEYDNQYHYHHGRQGSRGNHNHTHNIGKQEQRLVNQYKRNLMMSPSSQSGNSVPDSNMAIRKTTDFDSMGMAQHERTQRNSTISQFSERKNTNNSLKSQFQNTGGILISPSQMLQHKFTIDKQISNDLERDSELGLSTYEIAINNGLQAQNGRNANRNPNTNVNDNRNIDNVDRKHEENLNDDDNTGQIPNATSFHDDAKDSFEYGRGKFDMYQDTTTNTSSLLNDAQTRLSIESSNKAGMNNGNINNINNINNMQNMNDNITSQQALLLGDEEDAQSSRASPTRRNQPTLLSNIKNRFGNQNKRRNKNKMNKSISTSLGKDIIVGSGHGNRGAAPGTPQSEKNYDQVNKASRKTSLKRLLSNATDALSATSSVVSETPAFQRVGINDANSTVSSFEDRDRDIKSAREISPAAHSLDSTKAQSSAEAPILPHASLSD